MNPQFESKPELTAVWPLIGGLVGIHPLTMSPTELAPFAKGWMDHPDALVAREAGDVQIMIEESPQTLRVPGVEPPPKKVVEAPVIESIEATEATEATEPPAAASPRRRSRKRTVTT